MKNIILTGSPGTGKTTIAKLLSKKLKYKYIDVNKLIKEKKLKEKYIKKLDTYEVNTDKLTDELIKIIKKSKGVVIDSHLSHYIPKKYVNLCIVCKCSLKELKKRLEKRKYSKIKVNENLDSEIFDVCFIEAKEKKHNIITVDTTVEKLNKIIKAIKEII